MSVHIFFSQEALARDPGGFHAVVALLIRVPSKAQLNYYF